MLNINFLLLTNCFRTKINTRIKTLQSEYEPEQHDDVK